LLASPFLLLTIPLTGIFTLPSGTTEVRSEIRIPEGAHDLKIVGNHSLLHASAGFQGRAVLSCHNCRSIELRDFTIDGNRAALEKPMPMPPSNVSFARFYGNNGILIENSRGVRIANAQFKNITNFAVLVSASGAVTLSHVSVEDSGSLDPKGRNNTSGGVLLEEGTSDFTVRDSTFNRIRGNAVWTHSCYGSPRNGKGEIAGNTFSEIGRDAIQVGHAHDVAVTRNKGTRIGYPPAIVDIEHLAVPVAVDTAGDVNNSVYSLNTFTEIDGQCFDLDGFHNGEVSSNSCANRGRAEDYPFGHFGIALNNANPDMQSRNIRIVDNLLEGMKFGGIFVIGSGHQILRNRLLNVNTAHCNDTQAKFGCIWKADEPDMLRSGIYLSTSGARSDPARDNTIESNTITGWGMGKYCIQSASGVKLQQNHIRRNTCSAR